MNKELREAVKRIKDKLKHTGFVWREDAEALQILITFIEGLPSEEEIEDKVVRTFKSYCKDTEIELMRDLTKAIHKRMMEGGKK